MKMIAFITFVLIANSFEKIQASNRVRYDGYKVYSLIPKTEESISVLKSFEQSHSGYDFWTSVKGVGHPVHIMVPPQYIRWFNNTFKKNYFETEVYIHNVQKLIDNENSFKSRATNGFDWISYHTLNEINKFLEDLAEQNPEKVFLQKVGTSYEGRDINGVKLVFSSGNENRTVFIESNIHAREWISSAVSTWILNQLLTSTDAKVRSVADSHDWYIVPVFNPDGFNYTHTIDRMWRKTRTPYFFCNGVDPNRNWGHHFNDGGSSSYPCSNTYRGPHAFSEQSTKTISEFISKIGHQLEAYIAFHSYSQMFLIPYGYSSERLDNYQDLYNVGIKAAESLKQRYNTEYQVGNIVDLLYVASGGSMDWVKGTFGTPITYTYELRDTGRYGFILPADQIIPCAEETLDSLITIFEEFDKLKK